jgi:hypothetical protein
MRVRILSILVALIVVVAALGLGAWWYYSRSPSPALSGTLDDGPTLYEAIENVNRSVVNVTGGPWALFSIYGVAAQAPFGANAIGYPLLNLTVNACQAQFNGLTLWNGTMPVFNGTLNSGTAPFWQFGFYSNVSHQIVLATNVMGVVNVYPPMPDNGPCHPWYDLGNPEDWVQDLAPFLPNSPAVADSALTQMSKLTWFSGSSPWAEIYVTGPGVFDGFGDIGGFAGLILDRCGLLDVSNIQQVLPWAENLNGTGGGYANESTNCQVLNYPYHAGYGSYDLIPGASNTTVVGGTVQVATSYQVGLVQHNQTTPSSFDGWGLSSWLTSWNLTTGSGKSLAIGTPSCRTWVGEVADCVANNSGWFAVILSAGGEWLDSYGSPPRWGSRMVRAQHSAGESPAARHRGPKRMESLGGPVLPDFHYHDINGHRHNHSVVARERVRSEARGSPPLAPLAGPSASSGRHRISA